MPIQSGWSNGYIDNGISSVITPEGKQITVNYQDNTIVTNYPNRPVDNNNINYNPTA